MYIALLVVHSQDRTDKPAVYHLPTLLPWRASAGKPRPARRIPHPLLSHHPSHPFPTLVARAAQSSPRKIIKTPQAPHTYHPSLPPFLFLNLLPWFFFVRSVLFRNPSLFFFSFLPLPPPFSDPQLFPGVSQAANLTHSLTIAATPHIFFFNSCRRITGALETYSLPTTSTPDCPAQPWFIRRFHRILHHPATVVSSDL